MTARLERRETSEVRPMVAPTIFCLGDALGHRVEAWDQERELKENMIPHWGETTKS